MHGNKSMYRKHKYRLRTSWNRQSIRKSSDDTLEIFKKIDDCLKQYTFIVQLIEKNRKPDNKQIEYMLWNTFLLLLTNIQDVINGMPTRYFRLIDIRRSYLYLGHFITIQE